MAQVFILTLRQGLEAFLVVAALHACLEWRGRSDLAKVVRWTTAASFLLSVLAAYALRYASNEALWQGALAVAAAALAWRMSWFMRGAAGVFAFTALMVTRPGAQTAALLWAALFQVRSPAVTLAACAGTLGAAVLALAWIACARHVNRSHFLQATRVFLIVFVAQMSIYGFHELTEANLVPFSEPLHWATEPYGPDGRYGRYFSGLLVLAPLLCLAVMTLAEWLRPRPARFVTNSSHSVPNVVDGPHRPL